MDKAAASRASQHGVDLRVKYEGRYPAGQNGEALPSYMVAVACEAHGGTSAAAIADLEKFLTPAPNRQIEAWLAELSVICAKRRDGEFDETLRLEAYASRLSRYPADVVRHVLLERSWQFWPTWAELEKICDAKSAPRRHMLHAMKNPPEEIEERQPPTQAERERIRALIDEKFPQISSEWREAAKDEMDRRAGVA